jgi:DNA modification methylase
MKSKTRMQTNSSSVLDKLVVGDARQLPTLFDQNMSFADTIITSPPYGDLIDYGVRNQLGHGQTWESYLTDLKGVLQACHSLLKDTGSFWVIADAWREDEEYRLLPLEIANRAADLGWKLQDVIIWDKQHTLPYYRRGQFQPVYEYILFFTKTKAFKFYRDRIREVDGMSMWWMDFPERFNPHGKSPTNIWRFPIRPQGAWRGTREEWRHYCPFPTELVARIIELTTDEGDVVFDPFAGSGVVLATAAVMKRHYIGVELNPEFVKQFNSVVKLEVAREWKNLIAKREMMNSLDGTFTSLILRLRALKYARKVSAAVGAQIRQVTTSDSSGKPDLQLCVCIADIPDVFEEGDTLDASLFYLFSGREKYFDQAMGEVSRILKKFPLSHYRVNPTIKGFNQKADLRKALTQYSKLYLYSRAKPRSFESVQSVEQWLGDDTELPKGKVPPILSNLKVNVNWAADSYGPAVI